MDEDDDSVVTRPGPDGMSARDHAEAADRDLAAARRATRAALSTGSPPEGGDTAETIAELVGHVAPGDWGPALDLLRDAVKVAAAHLAGAERARSQR